MKKTILLLTAYCLLLTTLTTAAPTLNFQHNETQLGETILATITTTGEFTKQIEPSDIKFYEGRKQTSFQSDITFYDGTHYLYIYATRPGNFSTQIPNVLYKESNTLQSTTITKEFEIKEATSNATEILSIKPGFIFTLEIPKLTLTNTGTSTLNLTQGETKITLQPGAIQEITPIPEQVFSQINISTYKEFSIPIIYPPANSSFISPSIQLDLRHNPDLLLAELFVNIETRETIQLFNFGEENLTDIQTTSNLPFIKTNQPEDMPPRSTQNLTLTFNPENQGHFQGHVNITYAQSEKQNTLSIPLSLFVLPEGTSLENLERIDETCAEINGIICQSEEQCNIEGTWTADGEYCCLGTCQATETENSSEGGSYGWLIGIIILLVLGGGGYYLYKKQKKTTPPSAEEQLKETSKKFEKRISGTKRITGGLTKS